MSQGQVLLFSAGGLRLGVFLAEVGRLLVEEHIAPVPFSHPALAGVMIAGADGPVPVFDLHGLFGGTPATQAPGATVALFPTAKGPVGLRLQTLLGTIASYEPLSESATAALLDQAPEAARGTLTNAARTPEGAFSFFSPDAFLARVGL
ncbi:MAG: chemotaxis protein CheW [Deltaproteobacteria bacterium]|nr:chemotaxis protein CheW [Deltaproteobacteria bacterium]